LYGWRGRIGVILPSSNTTMENELYVMMPEGVSVHFTRVRLENVDKESLLSMSREAVKAAMDLATANVDVILYGCTSGSLIGGVGWEKNLVKEISKATGSRVITTASAVVEALRELGVSKIVVATPYTDEINRLEKKFLEDNGFEVLRIKGLGIVDNITIGAQPPWISYKLAREAYSPEADAVFISCTNFRSIEVIELLEYDLGVPVISSNTASAWLALKSIGVHESIEGYGVLLFEHL